eukprot:TRINITY_DN66558_c8_g1_i2.p1 TRINITY_DN66558_c8_g1~~TRINITY_DN66558_c8_g1_i2.p1  ORF type:complete len:1058 (-),score=490.65 TRINITY_DN66558_c8_g1_i2:44-3217(-)
MSADLGSAASSAAAEDGGGAAAGVEDVAVVVDGPRAEESKQDGEDGGEQAPQEMSRQTSNASAASVDEQEEEEQQEPQEMSRQTSNASAASQPHADINALAIAHANQSSGTSMAMSPRSLPSTPSEVTPREPQQMPSRQPSFMGGPDGVYGADGEFYFDDDEIDPAMLDAEAVAAAERRFRAQTEDFDHNVMRHFHLPKIKMGDIKRRISALPGIALITKSGSSGNDDDKKNESKTRSQSVVVRSTSGRILAHPETNETPHIVSEAAAPNFNAAPSDSAADNPGAAKVSGDDDGLERKSVSQQSRQNSLTHPHRLSRGPSSRQGSMTGGQRGSRVHFQDEVLDASRLSGSSRALTPKSRDGSRPGSGPPSVRRRSSRQGHRLGQLEGQTHSSHQLGRVKRSDSIASAVSATSTASATSTFSYSSQRRCWCFGNVGKNKLTMTLLCTTILSVAMHYGFISFSATTLHEVEGLTYSQIASFIPIFGFTNSFSVTLIGSRADKIRHKPLLLSGMTLILIAMMLFIATTTYLLMAFAFVLYGVGFSVFFVVPYYQIRTLCRHNEKRYNWWFMIFEICYQVVAPGGGRLMMMAFTSFSERNSWSWRVPWIVAMGMVVTNMFLLAAFARFATPVSMQKQARKQKIMSYRKMVEVMYHSPVMALMLGASVFSAFVFMSISIWFPTFAEERFGDTYSKETIGSTMTICVLFAIPFGLGINAWALERTKQIVPASRVAFVFALGSALSCAVYSGIDDFMVHSIFLSVYVVFAYFPLIFYKQIPDAMALAADVRMFVLSRFALVFSLFGEATGTLVTGFMLDETGATNTQLLLTCVNLIALVGWSLPFFWSLLPFGPIADIVHRRKRIVTAQAAARRRWRKARLSLRFIARMQIFRARTIELKTINDEFDHDYGAGLDDDQHQHASSFNQAKFSHNPTQYDVEMVAFPHSPVHSPANSRPGSSSDLDQVEAAAANKQQQKQSTTVAMPPLNLGALTTSSKAVVSERREDVIRDDNHSNGAGHSHNNSASVDSSFDDHDDVADVKQQSDRDGPTTPMSKEGVVAGAEQ